QEKLFGVCFLGALGFLAFLALKFRRYGKRCCYSASGKCPAVDEGTIGDGQMTWVGGIDGEHSATLVIERCHRHHSGVLGEVRCSGWVQIQCTNRGSARRPMVD